MSSQRAHLQQALGELFRRQLSTYSLLFHQAVARHLGIHVTDLKCLELVRGEMRLTPGRLAELTGLTTAAVTSILDRLERAGLVQRERDPSDRRKILVRPLEERAEEVARLFVPLDQALSDLFEQYTTEELALLNAFTTRVGQILQQETIRLHEEPNQETAEKHMESHHP